ncbi:MAG: SCO family protein [Gemmatimonadaceae bacterium]
MPFISISHARRDPVVCTINSVLIALVIVGSGCSRAPDWKGTPITPARDVSAFTFRDSANRAVSITPEKGGATLVFFGYTNCPDVCGTTLNDWKRVKKAIGASANRVRFVFVTIDPIRDTPAVAQKFVAQFDSTFIGVSADSATTAHMQNAFGVASARVDPTASEHYLMGHSSQTFMVNDRGQLVVMHAYAAGWDRIAADVKQLVD